MSLLLHVSDTHFGRVRPEVVLALERLIDERRPDIVVHSGDVTQRAMRSEFRAARELMDRHAGARWLVIPGNHDVPLWNPLGRLFRPYAGFEAELGRQVESEIELPDALVLGVNTTRRWRRKHGEVSKAQVERVSARLRRASPKQLRVVVTHQPVHVVAARDEVNRLRGAERAVAEWSKAGADLLLGGHIHLPYVRSLPAAPREGARQVWVVQAGTAVSSRVRGRRPNSLYLIHYAGGRECTVERWDFNESARAFEATERFELALGSVPRAAGAS